MSSPQIGSPQTPHQLFRDQAEKKTLEARNGLQQYDEVVRLVGQSQGVLNVTPPLIITCTNSPFKIFIPALVNFANRRS
jgi:hypothetical protein